MFTFETAPGTLIRGKLQTMITTNEEREENLREAGVEYLVEYPFNQEVAHMDPEQFVAEILVGKMGAKAIVSGPDCHLATSGRAMLNCFGNWHRNMDMRYRSLKGDGRRSRDQQHLYPGRAGEGKYPQGE